MRNNKRIYIWLPLIIGLSIGAGIFIGNIFSTRTSNVRLWGGGNNKLQNVFDYISRSYVDTVNINDLVEKAIPAVMSELDPHSTYISAKDMELTGRKLEGHFSGIGVEFILQDDTVAVVNAINGGPSDAIGIMSGDRIVMVNDTLFIGENLTSEKVFRTLRGAKNTKIKLGIKRKSNDELLDFTITRADVPVKSVAASYMLDEEIGLIIVNEFGSNTYQEFISAIAKLKSQGCKSFVIDLQQNTGGYMTAAIMMTNEFLPSGQMIVYTEGRTEPRENVFAQGNGSCKEDQVVVLIDEGSASASEIFAGAIQDNDRGLIVGRRSFGKGLVQSQHGFRDGSALRLTIARYHTPSGRCIQKAYEKGKREEYGKDLENRYLRGEFDNRDSIRLDSFPLFHTTAGRPVHGYDGILADVFVPRDTIGLNSYYLKVAHSDFVRDYAFRYTEQNREKLGEFKDWKLLVEYLNTQPLVNNLVDYVETKGIRRRPYLIEESRRLLQNQLEALVVRNILGDEGFFPIYQRGNKIIKVAIDLLKQNKATPESVRSEKYK